MKIVAVGVLGFALATVACQPPPPPQAPSAPVAAAPPPPAAPPPGPPPGPGGMEMAGHPPMHGGHGPPGDARGHGMGGPPPGGPMGPMGGPPKGPMGPGGPGRGMGRGGMPHGQAHGGHGGGLDLMRQLGMLGVHFYPPPMLLGRAKKLNLTPEQVTKLRQEMTTTHGRAIDLHAKVEHAKLDAARLLAADKVDERAVNAQIDEAAKAEAELHKLHVGSMLRVRALLTPEQRQKLDERGPGRPPKPGKGPGPTGQLDEDDDDEDDDDDDQAAG